MRRFNQNSSQGPGVRELAEIARDGRLGRVRGLRTVRVGWGRVHDDVDATWVLAPHDLSIALEILGEVPEPRAAVADVVGAAAGGLDGILATDSVWHVLSVSERSPVRSRQVVLHCEDGVALLGGGWDEHVTIVRPGSDGADEERVGTTGELPLLAELRAFVGHLDGGPAPRSSAREGALVVETISRLRALAGLA
jgi:predicted dehydrogenase